MLFRPLSKSGGYSSGGRHYPLKNANNQSSLNIRFLASVWISQGNAQQLLPWSPASAAWLHSGYFSSAFIRPPISFGHHLDHSLPFHPRSPLHFPALPLFFPSPAAHRRAIIDPLVFSFAFFWMISLLVVSMTLCIQLRHSLGFPSPPSLSDLDSYEALTALDAPAPAPVSKRSPSHALPHAP